MLDLYKIRNKLPKQRNDKKRRSKEAYIWEVLVWNKEWRKLKMSRRINLIEGARMIQIKKKTLDEF